MAGSVGTDLRDARERAHLSLPDLSARTKMRIALLEAIEREQFDRLPSGLLMRGYLRAYAREVGLDPEAIVRQYIEAVESEQLPPSAPLAEPPDTEWDSEPAASTRWSILAPAIPLTLAVVFFVMMNGPANVAPVLPVTPALVVTSEGTTGQQATDLEPLPLDAAQETPSASREVRLEIHPDAPTWIEASADGTRVLYETIDAGSVRVIEADTEIVMRVGDAGAFAYSINGTPGRMLGGPGDVRDIRITRDNLADFLMP